MKHSALKIGIALLLLIAGATATSAQSTSFTYQGKLSENGTAANGTYDIEFRLFDMVSGGAALATQQKPGVQVTDGVFGVELDYGPSAFSGTARYIEIAVKPAGAGSFTTMSPRTAITSAPYSIKSLSADNAVTATNATQLGGVNASSFIQTSDARLSDARPPTAGSASYIQNTNAPQASANFNIGGNGTVGGTLSAHAIDTNQFIMSGFPILRTPGLDSIALGKYAAANAAGGQNNIFIGVASGTDTGQGNDNSFFGAYTGQDTTGNSNTFIGMYAGHSNIAGSHNTLLGLEADTLAGNLFNATALGGNAAVSQSNSLILGSIAGVNNSGSNTSVGIGTTAPKSRLHIVDNSGNILFGNAGCNPGFAGLGFASTLTCTNYSLLGEGTNTILNRPTGGAIHFRENNTLQVSINPGGTVSISTLGSAGSTQLCRNASNQISTCSSSLRYKKDLQPFTGGLALVDRLQPITFRWKADDTPDLGFGAEDVAKVDPLLVIHNEKGEIEGVKYDRISAVLVNAIKEQQKQIAEQQKLIDAQRTTLANQQRQLNQLQRIVYRRPVRKEAK